MSGPALTELSDSVGLVTRPDPAGTSPQRDTSNIIKTSLPQVCDFSFSSVGASQARSVLAQLNNEDEGLCGSQALPHRHSGLPWGSHREH